MLCLDYSHPVFADCAEPRIRSTGRAELRGLYPAGILPVVFVYGVLVAATYERCSQTKKIMVMMIVSSAIARAHLPRDCAQGSLRVAIASVIQATSAQ